MKNMLKLGQGFLLGITIFFLSLQSFLETANAAVTHDLSSSSSYNIRIDGPAAGYGVASSLLVADIDQDGKQDLIIDDTNADTNGTDSGAVYLIYGTSLQSYSGSGNTVDLANSSSYNIRWDGAAAGDQLGARGGISFADIDNDGKLDLLLGARRADFNARNDSGSLYVIYNTLIDDYSGTGNNVSLGTSTNYNLRYDGAVLGQNLSSGGVTAADLDNNGKNDILVGKPLGGNGVLFIIYDSLIDDYTGTGNNIDLNISTNYNIAYSSPAGAQHPKDGLFVGDFDYDGKNDLLLGSFNCTQNGRTSSGCVFLIYNTLIDDYIGTGNSVSLSTSTNYNVRWDGANANDQMGAQGTFAGILNGNGTLDIVLNAQGADYNGRTDSGSLYVIFDTLIDNYAGTGNNVDLATTANFNIRIDGEAQQNGSTVGFSDSGFAIGDMDSDGKNDLLVGDDAADFNGKNDSGSVYIISNTVLDDFGTSVGNTVDIADSSKWNVRYDGAATSDLLSTAPKGVTVGDINGDGKNDLLTFALGADNNGRDASGSVYIIYGPFLEPTSSVAPPPASPEYLGGAPLPTTIVEKSKVISLAPAGAFKWDAYLSVIETPKTGTFRIPGTSFWQATPIYEVWWRSFFNSAKILSSEVQKPFTLVFKYNTDSFEKTLSEKALRLAYSTDGKKWKILPSLLSTKNNTLATITKTGGYYMLVSGYFVSEAQALGFETQTDSSQKQATPTPGPTPSSSPSPVSSEKEKVSGSKVESRNLILFASIPVVFLLLFLFKKRRKKNL